MSILTHNVMTALKRMVLPVEYSTARPKRLRFLIFNTAGRIVHHARRVVCRITGEGWSRWLELMPLPASLTAPHRNQRNPSAGFKEEVCSERSHGRAKGVPDPFLRGR